MLIQKLKSNSLRRNSKHTGSYALRRAGKDWGCSDLVYLSSIFCNAQVDVCLYQYGLMVDNEVKQSVHITVMVCTLIVVSPLTVLKPVADNVG